MSSILDGSMPSRRCAASHTVLLSLPVRTSFTSSPGPRAVTDNTLPPSTLPVAVLLVRDRTDRAKLAEALRGRAQPVFVDSAQDLELRVSRSLDPIIAVIAEPRDADGVPSAPALAHLHALRPGVSLVGYCDAGHEY